MLLFILFIHGIQVKLLLPEQQFLPSIEDQLSEDRYHCHSNDPHCHHYLGIVRISVCIDSGKSETVRTAWVTLWSIAWFRESQSDIPVSADHPHAKSISNVFCLGCITRWQSFHIKWSRPGTHWMIVTRQVVTSPHTTWNSMASRRYNNTNNNTTSQYNASIPLVLLVPSKLLLLKHKLVQLYDKQKLLIGEKAVVTLVSTKLHTMSLLHHVTTTPCH